MLENPVEDAGIGQSCDFGTDVISGNHVFLLGNYILSFGGSDSSTNLVIIVINIPGWFCFIVYWVASHFPISFLSCFSRSSWLTVKISLILSANIQWGFTFCVKSYLQRACLSKGSRHIDRCWKPVKSAVMERLTEYLWNPEERVPTQCVVDPQNPLSFSDSQNSEMLLNSQSQFITMNGYSFKLSEIEKRPGTSFQVSLIWSHMDRAWYFN